MENDSISILKVDAIYLKPRWTIAGSACLGDILAPQPAVASPQILSLVSISTGRERWRKPEIADE